MDGDHRVKKPKLDESLSKEDKMYFKSYADISIHEEMISDQIRTSTYRLAILKNYESIRGKVVLDVGAGTGVLSMFCIQAGARRVYAIEASDIAKEAEKVFAANNVSDKVTVLQGKVEEVTLPEKVDVIVSEWMGYFLLYETMLPSVLLARDKWLKQGGLVLPGEATLYLAPITALDYVDRIGFWDRIYDVDMSCLKPFARKCLTRSVHVNKVEPQDIQAHAAKICSLNLHTVTPQDLQKVKGDFVFDCFGEAEIHGFVSWFDVGFHKDITLTTSPYKRDTHWLQSVLYLEHPVLVQQGNFIRGSLEIQPGAKYNRFLDLSLKYKVDNREEQSQTFFMDDCDS